MDETGLVPGGAPMKPGLQPSHYTVIIIKGHRAECEERDTPARPGQSKRASERRTHWPVRAREPWTADSALRVPLPSSEAADLASEVSQL